VRPSRYTSRLRASYTAGEKEQVEYLLAITRVELALCCLVAIYLDPKEPAQHAALAYGLMTAYVLYSVALALWQRMRPSGTAAFQVATHGMDISWALAITLFTDPFFVFFVFVLLAAAYRWGMRETLWTAVGAVVLLLGVALVVPNGPFSSGAEGAFDLNRFIIRSGYLVVAGFMLGLLAEREKRLRAETSWLAQRVVKAQSGFGLRGTLETFLGDLLHLFDGRKAMVVAKETESGKAYLWEARREGQSNNVSLHLYELSATARQDYFFPSKAASWYATRQRDQSWEIVALDAEGRRLPNLSMALGKPFEDCGWFAAVSFDFGAEWSGRMILEDIARDEDREAVLSFLQRVIHEVGPSLQNVYLMRRLRSRVGAVERARVARELHDGPIQSLLAAEMHVNALRRQAAAPSPHLEEQLKPVEEMIHQEVLGLRELMEQMKRISVVPEKFLECLRDSVNQFGRETGIFAAFVSELDEVHLSSYVCRELVRITQEALINVRKHSNASEVLVRFGRSEGQWMLVIDDNGRGFPFSGRRTHVELDANGLGPAIIKERVRSLHGELVVESVPGQGTRLEVLLPPRSEWSGT
jgi:signal transduction histidine kinase